MTTVFNDCDIAYGKSMIDTDAGLELFKRFQEETPPDFINAFYVLVSDWAKGSGITKEAQLVHIRALMKVSSFPVGVFYSVKNEGFKTLTKDHITVPFRTFAGFGLMGDGITDDEMYAMLKEVHQDFGEYLKEYVEKTSLPAYLKSIVFWVTFGLIEALGVSTQSLLQKVVTARHSAIV